MELLIGIFFGMVVYLGFNFLRTRYADDGIHTEHQESSGTADDLNPVDRMK